MPSSTDRPPWLLLAVGIALVMNPLYLPVADFASPDHVYERAPISAQGDQLEWSGDLHVPIAGIDCFEEPDRACGELEALVNGSVVVSDPARAGNGPGPGVDPYVALESGWYERVATETADGYRLSLEPVTLSAVLESVARRPAELPERLRPAATGERVALESPLTETYVVREGGSYYYLAEVRTDRPPLGLAYRPLSWLGVLVGAVALVRAGRARAEYDGAG